ncbi:MAG: EAL domain-containing protein [Porticoccaceae bacterium]
MNDTTFKRKVLVADDDATSLLLMRQTLERFDFEVIQANDGQLALDKYFETQPHAILLDLNMPRKNGLEVCKAIREDIAGRHIPILMITGADDVDSINASYSAGATDFLSKPINWHLLGYKVQYALKNADAEEEKGKAEDLAEQLGVVVENSSNEIFLFNEDSLVIRYVNASAKKNLGYEWQELVNKSILDLLDKSEKDNFMSQMAPLFADNKKQALFETFITRKDGSGYPMELHVNRLTQHGKVVQIAIGQDITQRKKAEERMRYLAYYDPLTGLPNRQFFKEQLTLLIDMTKRAGTRLAVLFVDLDNFKRINDSLGHTNGDVLLKTIGQRLKESVRGSDLLAKQSQMNSQSVVSRLGGDEFTLVLNDVKDAKTLEMVVTRVAEMLAKPIKIGNYEVVVTASIGVSVFPDDGEDFETILHCADTAMYKAKLDGRNTYRKYDNSMSQSGINSLDLENDLRQGLEKRELEVHYQPTIDLETGRVIGAEALSRWTHPKHGMIPPAKFIAIAEQSGLISKLGMFVLEEACSAIKEWKTQGLWRGKIAVNVSGLQLRSPSFYQNVQEVFARYGIESTEISLEVTESTLMQDDATTLQSLRMLQAQKIDIAIDDFGTGYSSLAYLKRLPVNVLKIDQTFMSEIRSVDDSEEGIVSAIIAMARCLRLGVIAEGVETVEQYGYLRRHGVRLAQGYLFSKALPGPAFVRFAQKGLKKKVAEQAK